jgi:hypothetical protein
MPALRWAAAALCCTALGPAALHAALAAVAGTLFEAALFVLVAEALPAGRWRFLAGLGGCGCGTLVPGALSLGAIGLCWLAFGPAVTLARAGLAAASIFCRRGPGGTAATRAPDAFAELLALAPGAAIATLLAAVVATHAPEVSATPAGRAAAFVAGLLLGCAAPCGTAAVAIAAAFAPHLACAAAGVLVTGGIVPRSDYLRPAARCLRSVARCLRSMDRGRRCVDRDPLSMARCPPSRSPGCVPNDDTRAGWGSVVARSSLAMALATLAVSGPSGFINPRLVPLAGGAAVVALAGLRRRTAARGGVLVPAMLFLALAVRSPEPSYVASETQLDDAFAGERVAFTGVAHRQGATTILQRFAITCCRADASPLSVRITSALAVPDGSWISARGTLESMPGGLAMHANQWRRIEPPADPFVYR